MNREESLEVLYVLTKSLEVRGLTRTIKLLKTDSHDDTTTISRYEKFVLKEVSSEFGIDSHELIHSKYLRANNKYALGLCVHYLYDDKSLGEIQKNIFKNRTKTLLSKYRRLIFDLRPNDPQEKKILAIKAKIDKKIQNYKK